MTVKVYLVCLCDLNGPCVLQILQSSSSISCVQCTVRMKRPSTKLQIWRKTAFGVVFFSAKRIQFLCFPPTRIQKFLVCLVYGLQKLGFETMWDVRPLEHARETEFCVPNFKRFPWRQVSHDEVFSELRLQMLGALQFESPVSTVLN